MSQIVPLEPRSVGRILVESIRVCGRHLGRVLIIGAIPWGLLYAVGQWMGLPTWDLMAVVQGEWGFPPVPYASLFIYSIVSGCIIHPLVEGAIVHAVSESYVRRSMGIARAFRVAWSRGWALIGAFLLLCGLLLIGLVVAVGLSYLLAYFLRPEGRHGMEILAALVVYFIGMVVCLIRWSLVAPVVLLEGAGPRAALARSAALTAGSRWRVFAVMAGVWGVFWVMAAGVVWGSGRGQTVGNLLFGTLYVVVFVVLYFDLRVRKEGYSLAQLSAELGLDDGEGRGGCTT